MGRVSLAGMGGWGAVLGRVMERADLTGEQARAAMAEILEGRATPAQIAAFITALRVKGETVEEVAGMVRAMLEAAELLQVSGDLIDTCGTGGDRRGTINVSTIAAFVIAGSGLRVCKHGNRAASSHTGSADVLEALGVAIELGPKGVARCIEEAGMGFCYAPRFHPAMRHAAPVRRELAVPTVFNLLGPLSNPARVTYQVVGVSDPRVAELMAEVLVANGAKRAMVVWGDDGLDELSTTGASTVVEATSEGGLCRWRVDPAFLGINPAGLGELLGGPPDANARIAREVLAGAAGPHRDIVLLNAAAGLMCAGRVLSLEEGLQVAAESIDTGRAEAVLKKLVAVSQEEAEGEAAAR